MVAWLAVVATFIYSNFDGKLFPVTSRLEITSVTAADDGEGSYVAGRFTKLRNCTFQGLNWFYSTGGPGLSEVVVYSQFRDRPEIRETGEHEFFRLYVRLNEADIMNNSHVNVYHSCYNGLLWTTVTAFLHNHAE